MQVEEVKQLIEKGLHNAEVFVEGDGAHFTAIVVSPEFIGQSRIKKQQLVYATVQNQLLDGTLHALSVKTLTPDEWQVFNQHGL